MSTVVESGPILAERHAHTPGRLPEILTLNHLEKRQRAVVTHVEQGESSCQLQCLGFTEGGTVELIRKLSGGALLVFRVEGADVALRRETAATIRVRTEL